MRAKLSIAIAFAFLVLVGRAAEAAQLQVAVASNFERPMRRIAEQFKKDTGHEALITSGATGAFFAQIERGAPFEVLLAADAKTPERLEAEGLTVAGSRFTYALGTLVLWSARPGYVDGSGAVLKTGDFRHLAIANPQLAPYGAAAEEVLVSLGLLDSLRPRLVQGEAVAQTYQFVATGNAELGFVALSQVDAPDAPKTGSSWVVPANLYKPIQQDAALLRKGAANPAAQALCEYLTRPKVQDLIRSFGYTLPARPGF